MLESHPIAAPKLLSSKDPAAEKCDVLVLGLTEDGAKSRTLQAIDEQSGDAIGRMIAAGNLTGKPGELVLLGPSGAADLVLVVGLGKESEISRVSVFNAASAGIRKVSDRHRERLCVAITECTPTEMHDSVVSGAIFGCEGQGIYHNEPKMHAPTSISFAQTDATCLRRGESIGESINHTRRLVNEPPAMIYPESFTARCTELAETVGLECEIWDEEKLQAEGCRGILAVGRASTKPPRMMIFRHNGGGEEAPLAIVGKGVTFDSGGLSLKPSEGMIAMKCDMAGAATVAGVMHAIAKLGVKRNVIGFCGLAENMVSGDSYKLGDVIETRSGKTIEILNTDAEGRVVLADTLDVAIQHQPSAMIDLATLTGACMVALGVDVAGLMSNDQALCDAIEAAAIDEGEPVWQLPMFDLYDEKIKSKIADIKNVGEGRFGGAITAAKFLEQFVGDVPWVHIDIAGPAFRDSPKPYRDAGATGVMVRTLIRWIELSENV